MPTRRITTTRKPAPTFDLLGTFKRWANLKGINEAGTVQQNKWRDQLKDWIKDNGEEDDKGSFWVTLPEIVTYENPAGKVFKYALLKAQRSLSPAVPQPDPDKAEALLRKKKLWLTEAQENELRALAVRYPQLSINWDIDLDYVTSLVFKKVISDKEYEATLVEQTENFSFVPAES